MTGPSGGFRERRWPTVALVFPFRPSRSRLSGVANAQHEAV